MLDKLLNNDFGVRINTDEIVNERFNNDWQSQNAQIAAARIAVKLRKDCLDRGESFNQETTLVGNTIITNIKRAKDLGFKINLFYVGLESVELSIKRVEIRRHAGGHGIPKEDLQRRYTNSFENLELVLPLCDSVQIYDNSGSKTFDILIPLLVVQDGQIIKWDNNCPKYIQSILMKYAMWLNGQR